MKRSILLLLFLFLGILSIAEAQSFGHIKIHRHKSPQNRVLVDKVGILTFDDAKSRISFKSDAGDPFEIAYDAVATVVFEVTTHMRGGALSQVVSLASVPGAIAGAAIAGKRVHDYWFYVAYKSGDRNEEILLEVPKSSSEKVIAKATSVFGPKVTMAQFQEKAEEVDREKLPDLKSKHILKVNRESHPLPESKPDKAVVVVVCPPLAARYSGRGNQFKLHANDRVIAVNKSGTYTFAYLDPGKYRLVSQSENASGFEMELEAGKTYYFLQNTFQGAFKGETMLSRNSPELVMYELDGSYFSDWTRRGPEPSPRPAAEAK
jgi:hypothetical protein